MPDIFDIEAYDLRYYLQVAGRMRYWCLAVVGALTVAAGVINYTSVPVYQAKATLLIEKTNWGRATESEISVDTRQEDYYRTQHEILRSYALAKAVVAHLNLTAAAEFVGSDPAEVLTSNLQVMPIKGTRLVDVLVESRDPRLATTLANAVCQAYINRAVEGKEFVAQNIMRLLDGNASRSDLETLPESVSNVLIQSLKSQLSTLETAEAELAGRYTAKHRRRIQLAAQIKSKKEQIEQELLNVAESVKTQMSMRMSVNNIRIMDVARVPQRPVRPRKARNMVVALALSVVFCVTMVLSTAHLDQTIHNPEEVELRLRIPTLGVIPSLQSDALDPHFGIKRAWEDGSGNEFSSLMDLRTAVSFALGSETDKKALIVCSACAQEGKSFISAHLALAFAKAGERVLLVDADLRRPRMHDYFLLDRTRGLSNVAENVLAMDVQVQDTAFRGLQVLTAGPNSHHAVEKINDNVVNAVLGWTRERIDRIIIDTPPLMPTSDALIWARAVRKVLIVIQSGQARTHMIVQIMRKLQGASASIIGVALNKAEANKYYYYYSATNAEPDRRRQRRSVRRSPPA
ncbi:MAG: polysaccharide biosynthesis tyrosine autokinase [Elusimicrobia bacterium]|nr:polysaccharide biosynthesis tyrosine autokinase [Elusimicrobiota bacterium]